MGYPWILSRAFSSFYGFLLVTFHIGIVVNQFIDFIPNLECATGKQMDLTANVTKDDRISIPQLDLKQMNLTANVTKDDRISIPQLDLKHKCNGSEVKAEINKYFTTFSGFIVYMLVGSVAFQIYLLANLVKHTNTFENKMSHASGFLRWGAAMFGLGSFIWHILELFLFVKIGIDDSTYRFHSVTSFLSNMFIILQVIDLE